MADNDNLVLTVSSDMTAAKRGLAKFIGDINSASNKVAQSFDRVGKSIDNSISSSLQQRINASVGIGVKASKEWTGALADQGKELERLRARYSPLFATINQYKTAVADIKRAHAIGAISANEMAAAISKERQAALASIAAIKGRNAALAAAAPTQRGVNNNVGAFQTANIAAQFQDIAVTSAMGMSPLQIALQQGTQLSSVFSTMGSGKQVAAGLTAAFASLVSPVSLVTIGLIAGGAAAVQFGFKAFGAINTAEDVLKKHEETIKSIRQLYDDAAESSEQYGRRAQGAITFAANQDQNALQKSLQTQLKVFADKATPKVDVSQFDYAGADIAGITEQLQTEQFGKFAGVVKAFINDIQSGKGDVLEFNQQIQDIANADQSNKKLQETAASILKLTQGATDAAKALEELNKKRRDLEIAYSRTASAANAQKYQADNAYALTSMQREQAAALGAIGARSPQELAAAARARVAAQPINPNESPAVRQYRIEAAGALALAQAEQQITEAKKDRARSLESMLADQQNEIDLIGKTGGEAEALRRQYELIAQLKEEAARNGTEVDQAEIAAIKEKAKQLGQLTDTYNKLRLQQDLLLDARFNSLSKQDQQITTVLRQYGLPEDLNSNEAGQIRQSLNIEDARSELKSFFGDFKDALLHNGGDIGKAFADSIQNALLNQVSKLWDKLIDQFVNDLIGTPSIGNAAASNGSGLGALFSSLFGGSSAKTASAITGAAPVIPVTRAPLGDISAYAKAIQSIESGGNYGALGPLTSSGDRAYGAYQVMGANIPSWTKGALGYSMSPSDFLGSKSAQDAVFSKYFGASVSKFGNPQDAASVWFTGRPLSQGAGASDVLGTTGSEYVDKFTKSLGGASDAIDVQLRRTTDASAGLGKLANSAGTATNGLGSLGSGLDQFGQKLSTSFFPEAPSGGGGGGWLSSLFGSFTPIGAQATLAFNGGIGLYADGGPIHGPGSGTSDDVPAMLSNGEYVINAAATRRHRRLLDAINSGSIARFASGGLVRSSVRGGAGASGVGSGVVVNITNNSSAQIKQQQKQTAGGTQIDVMIDEAVADKINTPGSRSRSAMQGTFGLKGGLARR